MKVNINVTVNLTDEQVRLLVISAEESGYGFDGTKDKRLLIKRYLEGKVTDTVAYIHEKVTDDIDDDDRD